MQFGRRSEKLDPDQFNLALEDLERILIFLVWHIRADPSGRALDRRS
jgi:Transposase C of IS166 homeodomain